LRATTTCGALMASPTGVKSLIGSHLTIHQFG
jgi:hypothetical protein